ncbi:putative protein phosphatase CG10417 like protein [Argiope bruennichi]|uniref:Uncharacterized protein n=1 Tax=Argiope bruennichi TaxID=94029 RepID=A0A8T0F3H9_ARGBR|nr:putative protein phosphatase CG10417 like protein [Argiope bruennichi]
MDKNDMVEETRMNSWNSMSSQDVVDYINVRLQDGRCDLEEICEEMFRLILAPDTDNDGSGCDNMCCIIVKFNKKGNSSFIYKASVSNEVKSSDGSLKQEGENVNTPTCGTADQMTTNISEKISPVDEKSIHQSNPGSHLTAQYSNHYMQHLENSGWIDFSIQQGKVQISLQIID